MDQARPAHVMILILEHEAEKVSRRGQKHQKNGP
jgi:hypothetical protein